MLTAIKAFLDSPITWGGALDAVSAYIVVRVLFGLLLGLVYRAVRRRLVRKAVERAMSGGPEGAAELKKFLEHIGFKGTVHEVKITNDRGHAAPPAGGVN